MKAGWWDACLALKDLAKAICMHVKIWFLCQALFIKLACLANVLSSKMFGCHYQLVTVDRHRYWMCVFVFLHFIMASKILRISHVTPRTEKWTFFLKNVSFTYSYSMQGWTSTAKHGVTRKRRRKGYKRYSKAV